MEELRKNMECEADICSYTSEGLGVARIAGRAVFIPYAIVSERHRIRIVKVNNTVCYGKSMEVLKASPERRTPPCPYYFRCGGCSLMHMSYQEELRFKLDKVNEIIRRIGKQEFEFTQIIPSEQIYRYRNKAVFNVAGEEFGFFRSRTHDLISIDDCLLQSEESIAIAKQLEKRGLNHIYIRNKVCTVAGKSYNGPVPEGITGLVLCDNARENSIVDGNYSILWGSDLQTEHLCGYDFVISPQSFFQINRYQTSNLYQCAYDLAVPGEEALELYCGAGAIGIILSDKYNKIHACDIVPEAINNAKRNAELNNINNIIFTCCDAKDMYIGNPNTIIVDPPRKGLDADLIVSVLNIQPEHILYISCNPATLARDISLLSSCYYLSKGIVVDMFPRTYHVETVVLMSRK